MLKPSYTKQFERDLKKIKKRGKNTKKLKSILSDLIDEKKLEEKYRDHKLIGNYKGRRECHIEPNWLLIYKIDNDIIKEKSELIIEGLRRDKNKLLLGFKRESQ